MIKHCYKLIGVACVLLSTMTMAQTMSQSEFQSYVVKFLSESYKQHSFSKSDKQDAITVGGIQMSLTALYTAYSQGQIPDEEIDGVLKNSFEPMLAEVASFNEAQQQWQQVKGSIRPQLAPIAYLEKADLVHQKLDDKVIATFVIDDKHSYKYVTDDYFKSWKVSIEDLVNAANENLINISANMPMNISNQSEKFIVVQANDGYDAARIMVPQIRAFFSQHLGEQFYAAMPYRDILLVWSDDNTEAFKARMHENIKGDFAAKQYALSPNIFKVNAQGIKVVDAVNEEKLKRDNKE